MTVTFLKWNCNSIFSKLENFQLLLKKYDHAVILLQETNLHKFRFSMLKIFKISYCVKKYMSLIDTMAKIPEKIVFIIIKNYIFRNTRVICAIFLNLMAQFSKKIHIFFEHGSSFDPQNPPCARFYTILLIFIM